MRDVRLRPSRFKHDVASLDMAEFVHGLFESLVVDLGPTGAGTDRQIPDSIYLVCLLCEWQARDETDGRREGNEFSAALVHSITSSTRTSTDCGIVMPKTLAVLKLITSSNFVGC